MGISSSNAKIADDYVILSAIGKYINPSFTRLIDLDCSDGGLRLLKIHEEYPYLKLHGITEDESALEVAEKRLPRAVLIHSDIFTPSNYLWEDEDYSFALIPLDKLIANHRVNMWPVFAHYYRRIAFYTKKGQILKALGESELPLLDWKCDYSEDMPNLSVAILVRK